MESLPYILPLVLLVLAAGTTVAVKFLSIKSAVGGGVIGLLSLFMLGCSIYLMIISSGFEERIAEKEQAIADMEQWKYQHLDEMSLIIAQLNTPEDKHVALLKQLNGFGWQADNKAIKLLTDAHEALESLKSDNTDTRTRYLIKGVPTAVDRKIVEIGLRNIGFRIVAFKEQEEVPVNSNALYFGQNVDIESVKMAALTLIQAGIEIKSIKPFKKPTRGNVRAIKIDWSKYLDKKQPLAIDAIVKAKKFK